MLRSFVVSVAVVASLASGLMAETPRLPRATLNRTGDLRARPPIPASPDPAAISLAASFVSRSSDFEGRIQIRGVVRNIGFAAYQSSRGQQAVDLYELPAGGRARRVATQAFQNLAPGQEVSVSFTRNWRVSDEFPPSYQLVISYDPDIRLDGNMKNDDSNLRNNAKTLSPDTINRLFGR